MFILASYLVGDLELLALADVGGLGDGGLKSAQGPVVQGLHARHCVSTMFTPQTLHPAVIQSRHSNVPV